MLFRSVSQSRYRLSNAVFDRDEGGDGMETVEEFYPEQQDNLLGVKVSPNQAITEIQQIQQGLQQSVRVVN